MLGEYRPLVFFVRTERRTSLRSVRTVKTSGRYSPIIKWLAPRAGKMNQIARCDWLPERARWSHLARSGLPAVSRKQNFTKSHIINPLLTKFVRSRWLDIGLVLFLRVYGPRLRLGPQTRKKRTWPISSHLDLTSKQAKFLSRKQNFTKSHIINPLLTKFVRSRWLDIGLVLFLRVYGPRLRLGP